MLRNRSVTLIPETCHRAANALAWIEGNSETEGLVIRGWGFCEWVEFHRGCFEFIQNFGGRKVIEEVGVRKIRFRLDISINSILIYIVEDQLRDPATPETRRSRRY